MLKKTIAQTIIIILLCTMVITGSIFISLLLDYHEGSQKYENLLVYVTPSQSNNSCTNTDQSTNADSYSIQFPSIDFQELQNINPDVIGWIQIPNTSINYPILQGDDNSYYLTHLIDGTWNRSGSIFLDCRSNPDLKDKVSIIHGHNMLNGTMFQDLELFKSQDFFNENPYGYLLTPSQNYIIRFFSGCLVSVSSNIWDFQFNDKDSFFEWIYSAVEQASTKSEDFFPTEEDNIVLMSTCSYEFDNARWTLIGVLIPI